MEGENVRETKTTRDDLRTFLSLDPTVIINLLFEMQPCSSEENGAKCTDLGFTRIEHMLEAKERNR